MVRKLWIAGMLAGLPAPFLTEGMGTPVESFAWCFPLLVICGGWFWIRYGEERGRVDHWIWALALLFMVPALGTRVWNQLIAADYVAYLDPVVHVREGVGQAAATLHGVGLFIAVSGIVIGLLFGRRAVCMASLLIGGGIGGWMMEVQLGRAAEALLARDGRMAMESTAFSEHMGWLGLLAGLIVGAGFERRFRKSDPRSWSAMACGIALIASSCAWLLRSPVPALLESATPVSGATMVESEPGASVPLQLLDPWAEDFMERAVSRGRSETPVPWQCSGRDSTRWLDVPRLSVAIAVDRTHDIDQLDPILWQLYQDALHRVVLVARASGTSGALAEFLAYPGVPLVLEPPPAGAHWVRLGAEFDTWVRGGPPAEMGAICVLLPEPGLPLETLYSRARVLWEEGNCGGLSLIPTPHRSAFDGDFTEDPGCVDAGEW